MLFDYQGFGHLFVGATAITVAVWSASLVTGAMIGLAGAAGKLWGGRAWRWATAAYTTTVRGVPDLLVIFVVYFGGTVTLSTLFGRYVEVHPFVAGVVALAAVSGAYQTEIFRGAILGVPRGQIDAACAICLRPVQVFAYVVMPQAWRLALPAWGNQAIALLKQTSLISVVGLEEIMRRAGIASGATSEPFRFYVLAAMIYFAMSVLLTAAFARAERMAGRGHAAA